VDHIPKQLDDDPVVEVLPSFDSFYASEYRGVIGLAYALSNSPAAAEELAQDAFVAAFRKWEAVARMDRPDAWVRRVVANLAASRVRRLVAETRARVRNQGAPLFEPEPSTDAIAVWSEVASLPRRQTEVVVLVYYAMLSHAEVADVLGCSVETVRTHLKRAKRRLKRALE
jgi:RNA polymerase sigma-70 factor (ECF subfamily)